eukprot:21643-Eustigmatos_ZCMA.PRE.1
MSESNKRERSNSSDGDPTPPQKRKDHDEAEWEATDVTTLFNLGVSYYDGDGVPQDWEKAVKFYQMAADKGSIEAVFNLGVIYEVG